MATIRRVFVEKKSGFTVEADSVFMDLRNNLGVDGLEKVRIVNRYDVSGITDEDFQKALKIILSEPPVDNVCLETFDCDEAALLFAVEFLPGQYDQRADSAKQCIELIAPGSDIAVLAAKVYLLFGKISDEEKEKIKNYYINPVEAREASLEKPDTLALKLDMPENVKRIDRFVDMDIKELEVFKGDYGLAMSLDDIAFCQKYFQKEKRNPSITEIRVLDTYWSHHCRHTTFNTVIDDVEIIPHRYNTVIQNSYDKYIADRSEIYAGRTDKPITLMDIAVLGMKKLSSEGKLDDLDKSEEVNACSIVVPVEIDGKEEEWLIMFKNETHNHPTEIEPFGGASTCLGGAIRDPLSGRAYVYQAMRVTGGGDPRTPVKETLSGKLPQRKIALGAAAGYSSYGNQIGLSTGVVKEFYNERFVAKRMEVGALVGAVRKDAVDRQSPISGDKIILLGGRTGRDGCGGATGSSKEHTVESITTCGADVQKGNALVERNILRLFRDPIVTRMIKRCNDFGAGGVSVAIGELADGVKINLDVVPKKYEGLDGTELAISESQERMALVVSEENAQELIRLADRENIEATIVAEVTDENRMVMHWRGDKIVDIDRDFLNTNGVTVHTSAIVKPPICKSYLNVVPKEVESVLSDVEKAWTTNLARLDVCSQKGVIERFDSTIGRGSVLLPLGGKNQLTPAEGMVANVPAFSDNVSTSTVMTYGYNPELASWSPFYGAFYAVVESVCRAVALGADPDKIRLSLQEYFEKMLTKESWGLPLSALLGAYEAQLGLDAPAIGGKDSMSGTFMELNVPPTLISFALGIAKNENIISSEFKNANTKVVFLATPLDENELVVFEELRANLKAIHKGIIEKTIISSATINEGGIAATISKMCFGNDLGFIFNKEVNDLSILFTLQPGGFIFELAETADPDDVFPDLEWMVLGNTTDKAEIIVNDKHLSLDKIKQAWTKPLNELYPTHLNSDYIEIKNEKFVSKNTRKHSVQIAKPRVIIPVFPGTNCEYDMMRAFSAAGADPKLYIVRNKNAEAIKESVQDLVKEFKNSQIIALAGGFSSADEPEGSGKFIATMFRNPFLKEAITDFLNNKDGLMLGICNGFQALIKLGLLPYGEIKDMDASSPTLTFNSIGRHISTVCKTKIVSNMSPWLSFTKPDDTHYIALSSGEGRFFASQEQAKNLFAQGQVAAQYVDENNNATMVAPYNPNGSVMSIESITSPDGRILGKMCHTERWIDGVMKNIPGEKNQPLFKGGVNYFA